MCARPMVAVLLLLLAGCSDATTVEFAAACKAENDGKLIRTAGRLHAPFAALCRRDTRRNAPATVCSFDLRDKAADGARLSLNVEVGGGGNRVDQARAKLGAAAVRDDGGKDLAEGAEVRVTGILRAVPNSLRREETICWLDVERIERR